MKCEPDLPLQVWPLPALQRDARPHPRRLSRAGFTPWIIVSALFLSLTAPAQDWAKARLDNSPRHGEWVTVTQGTRKVKCFLTYPEVAGKAT